jgi:hypothetical protein
MIGYSQLGWRCFRACSYATRWRAPLDGIPYSGKVAGRVLAWTGLSEHLPSSQRTSSPHRAMQTWQGGTFGISSNRILARMSLILNAKLRKRRRKRSLDVDEQVGQDRVLHRAYLKITTNITTSFFSTKSPSSMLIVMTETCEKYLNCDKLTAGIRKSRKNWCSRRCASWLECWGISYWDISKNSACFTTLSLSNFTVDIMLKITPVFPVCSLLPFICVPSHVFLCIEKELHCE